MNFLFAKFDYLQGDRIMNMQISNKIKSIVAV